MATVATAVTVLEPQLPVLAAEPLAAAAVTAAAAVLAVTADLPLVPTILVLERRLQTLMPWQQWPALVLQDPSVAAAAAALSEPAEPRASVEPTARSQRRAAMALQARQA